MPDIPYKTATLTAAGYGLRDQEWQDPRGDQRLRLWFAARPVFTDPTDPTTLLSTLDRNGMAPYLRIECRPGLSIMAGERRGRECAANGPFGGLAVDPSKAVTQQTPMVLWMSTGSFPLRFAASLSIHGGGGEWSIRLWATVDPADAADLAPQWCEFAKRIDAGPAVVGPVNVPIYPAFADEPTFTAWRHTTIRANGAVESSPWVDVASVAVPSLCGSDITLAAGDRLFLQYGVQF